MSRVLAVHSGALGDVILFARLLERIDGEVTLVAGGEKARLMRDLGAVRDALDFDALPMHEVFSDTPLEACGLPGLLGSHDRLLSCFAAGDRTAEFRLAALCGAAEAHFLPIRPPEPYTGHLVEAWCEQVGRDLPGRVDAFEAIRTSALTTPNCPPVRGSRKLAIHPGSGGAAKCWPLERFIEVGRAARRRWNLAVEFYVGPAEIERRPAGQLDALAAEFTLIRCPALDDLAQRLREATVYVGNDSGVSHLAASLAVPTIVLFGPTNPAHFAPLGPSVTILARPRLTDIEAADVLGCV